MNRERIAEILDQFRADLTDADRDLLRGADADLYDEVYGVPTGGPVWPVQSN